MKILDCTLRDGGYYTNWDFSHALVESYIKSCNDLPIDYLELGYRSIPLVGYHGEYYYLPDYILQRIKDKVNKKLVIILNEKDIRVSDLQDLLIPCVGLIDMVRLAIDPHHLGRALILAEQVKRMGFEVGFNVMYMSKWKTHLDFLNVLPNVKGVADYFYMVDSYGGVYPSDVRETIQIVRSLIPDVSLGFHGHNNLELALINTLTAIEEGCDIVDATITGMGRGAGNVKTELLLTALSSLGKLDVDFNSLSRVVDDFSILQKSYEWGTNLPYMISGAHSLPQKEVMEWVGKRYYSFNSIIRALENQAKGIEDNLDIPGWKYDIKSKRVLIVGGGDSIIAHKEAIINFLKNNNDVLVIHASSKNALSFESISNQQVFCLVGNEGQRMEEVFNGQLPRNIYCILPPSPRKMGTFIPSTLLECSFQLDQIYINGASSDSVTALALEFCKILETNEIYLVGYDGYSDNISQNQVELFNENDELFRSSGFENLISLTPTKYSALGVSSIYAML
jgi:4-hydroxy 2-oxovalerate aldolase